MHLCEACARFARAISQKASLDSYFKETTEVLRQQQKCSFCAWLLTSSVYKNVEDETYPSLCSIITEYEEFFDADEHYVTYRCTPIVHRCEFKIRTPLGTYRCDIRFSAEEGISIEVPVA
jgi:hypothetical protein